MNLREILGWACIAALAFVNAPAAASPASTGLSASGCSNREWSYAVTDLQEARRRIKSRSLPQAEMRARCGLQVLEALEQGQMPTDCPACNEEYVQLLRDTAYFANIAASLVASKKYQKDLRESEIQIRIDLNTFLIDSSDDQLISKYWRLNFEELGDALDNGNDARRYHEQASLAPAALLSRKSYGTWVKAIRSCEVWDFRQGEKRDMPGLRKALCGEGCRRGVERLRARAHKVTFNNKDLFLERLDDMLPDTAQCPVGEEP